MPNTLYTGSDDVRLPVDGKQTVVKFNYTYKLTRNNKVKMVSVRSIIVNSKTYALAKIVKTPMRLNPQERYSFLKSGNADAGNFLKQIENGYQAQIANCTLEFAEKVAKPPQDEQEEPDDDAKKTLAAGTGVKSQYLSTIDRFISFMLDDPSI